MSNSEYDDSLAAYESDEDTEPQQTNSKQPEKTESTHYSVHLSGFKEFLLKPELLRSIADCGFEHPSPVQTKTIPAAILGTDLICQAKSGMGKTAVFVLACLHQLDLEGGKTSILILTHARELAYQINREFHRFMKYIPGIETAVFYGGVPVQEHKNQLKKPPHIVIGTPGRILQLIKDKDFKVNNIKHFVLDECDKMLESLDMRRDVQEIFRATPHEKQVMMFSATLSNEIRPVCKKFMHHPLEIYINDMSKLTLHGLQQYYCELQEKDKNRKLIDLLDQLDFNQLVVFVNTVDRASHLNKLLEECNFPSTCIHSKMPQEQRIDRYRKFKEFQSRIMVATNLFGRGIDIERVNVVINYDMPENSDTYLHRVGRAGRFGTRGLAISFAASEDDAKVLNETQSRFVVSIPSLPEEIDPATYK